MSNNINTGLIEEAIEYVDSGDLSGTRLDEALLNDLESMDLEMLYKHVTDAREMLREE